MIGFVAHARRAIGRRLPDRGEDSGSIPFALLVMIIGLAIGALLVPMAVTQDHTTNYDNSRVAELHAAESGFEVALGMIRSSTGIQPDGTLGGLTTTLPCAPSNLPITGAVAGSGNQSYSVTLAYYTQSPTGQSQSWLNDPANKMLCVPNYGPYLPSTNTYVPSYVVMTSTGKAGSGTNGSSTSRVLQSTYVVQTSNTNINGGTISIYPPSAQMCMAANSQAASTVPVPGTTVVLEPCETDPTDLGTAPPDQASPGAYPWQVWAYNPDLSIELVSSDFGGTYPNGLCLDAGTPHAANVTMVLQPCTAAQHDSTTLVSSGAATAHRVDYSQEWSIDNSSHLEGSLANESDLDGYCVTVPSQAAGTVLTLQTSSNAYCTAGVTSTNATWVPSANAGAGGSGAANSQVVNFQQFGRCLDVTNNTVNGNPGGNTFLIAYTCKQDPNTSKLDWNQLFVPDSHGYGELITYNGGNSSSPYCLTSPLSAYTTVGTGPYVTVTACPVGKPVNTPGNPSPVVWTTYANTDSDGNTLPYAQKYTKVDAKGFCLSLTQGTADAYNGAYSKAIVSTCDGSTAQKWNAQANLQTPLLENTVEITGQSGS